MKTVFGKYQTLFSYSWILPLFFALVVPSIADAEVLPSALRPDRLNDLHVKGLEYADGLLKDTLKLHISDPRLLVKTIKTTLNPNLVALASRTYQFMVDDIPVCNKELRVHNIPGFEHPILMGKIPEIDAIAGGDHWPDWHATKAVISQALADYGSFRGANVAKVIASDRCYYLYERELVPVWKSEVTIKGLSYILIADDQKTYALYKNYFDIDGAATIYPNNPYDSELSTFVLKDLDGEGVLENEFFYTSTTGLKAYSESHTFSYSPASNSKTKVTDDGRFDETSLFVNANRHYDWFKTIGYEWPKDQKKLLIVAHAVDQGSANFANYVHQGSKTPPTINVGDGNGIGLQNLPKDFDVVAHEFGHHVIFQTMQDLENSETLTLHEAIADYFVFASTGNSCLCESVCTKYNGVSCAKPKECLRTADNTFVFGNQVDENTQVHERAQFISAMLWDLRSDYPSKEGFDKLVYNAVMLMQTSSGYHDFVLALLLAEKSLTDGENCPGIYDGAVSRGLESFISDFNCDNISNVNFLGEKSEARNSKTKGKNPLCGTLGNPLAMGNLLMLLLLLSPLLAGLVNSKRLKLAYRNFAQSKFHKPN